uniref:50S ribosomal protein L20 n=1 Tax=Codium arabicum TaxID=221038 RepID=A0A386B0M4_CODAR|nr:ribosomal protein L20 [Codium arabicum]AYC65237.1 ribosomal protein L20 [Codium arabicum]
MIRIKRGKNAKTKRKKILNQTKSFQGSSNKLYSSGRQTLLKANVYNYTHRKLRKRLNRQLWIIRLNAFLNKSNLNYNFFIYKLKFKNIQLNRKICSQLILFDPLFLNNI